MAPDVATVPRPTISPALRPWIEPLGALLLVLVVWNFRRFTVGADPGFPLDDAYITLHNARLLITGQADTVFVGASPLAGSTSPLHTLLVALLSVVLPVEKALDATLWMGVWLYVVGLLRLARIHAAPPVLTVLLLVLGLTAGATPYHLLNGLETGLAMAAITWTLVLAGDTRPRRAPLAALLAVLPFVRPELALVSLAMAPTAFPRGGGWKALRLPIVVAVAALVPLTALCTFRGDGLFSATAGAKDAFFAQATLPLTARAAELGKALVTVGESLGPIAALLPLAFFVRGARPLLLALLAFVALYALRLPIALTFNTGRYWHPWIPLLIVGILAPIAPRDRRLVVGFAALASVWALWNVQGAVFRYLGGLSWTGQEVRQTALFCRDRLPRDARLLVHDVGMIGWLSERPAVDMVGLKTTLAAQLHRRITLPSGGADRGRAISELALQTHTDYMVVLGSWERGLGVAQSMQDQGWRLTLVKTPTASFDYAIYHIEPPRR